MSSYTYQKFNVGEVEGQTSDWGAVPPSLSLNRPCHQKPHRTVSRSIGVASALGAANKRRKLWFMVSYTCRVYRAYSRIHSGRNRHWGQTPVIVVVYSLIKSITFVGLKNRCSWTTECTCMSIFSHTVYVLIIMASIFVRCSPTLKFKCP